ncbi:MAG TPA: hypothetical protein VF175_01715 [Lacipirellula sp.]
MQFSGFTIRFSRRLRTALLVAAAVAGASAPGMAAPLVRIGYVIPSDRRPQPLATERLQELMLAVQDWYGSQVQRWGLGYKTFDLEMMPDGVTPKVHVVNTSKTAATIRGDVWSQTISAAQGAGLPIWSSQQVWLLVPESHMQSASGAIAGKTSLGGSNGSGMDGGVAIMESDFLFRASPSILTDTRNYGGLTYPEVGPYPFVQGVSFHDFEGSTISSIASSVQGATAHELGHAFGLGHDFRNDQNFDGNHMGNGLRGWRGAQLPELFTADDMYLAEGAALALNTSRYFNFAAPVTDQTRPTVTLGDASTINIVDGQLRIPFTATDAGQLSAALLRRNGEVIGELPLNGILAREAFTTPWYEPGQNDEFTISVYDAQGNRRDSSIDITPATGSNRAPQPAIDLGRSTIIVGQAVLLDASRSIDPDGNSGQMTVQWDFDGDGVFDLSPITTKVMQRRMLTPGDFRITAQLTDAAGAKSISAPLMLRVVDRTDFDNDGDVDGDDLLVWGDSLGTTGSALHMNGDADGDRDVDGRDFLLWQREIGGTALAAAASSVPEPAAALMFGVACCFALHQHRRV